MQRKCQKGCQRARRKSYEVIPAHGGSTALISSASFASSAVRFPCVRRGPARTWERRAKGRLESTGTVARSGRGSVPSKGPLGRPVHCSAPVHTLAPLRQVAENHPPGTISETHVAPRFASRPPASPGPVGIEKSPLRRRAMRLSTVSCNSLDPMPAGEGGNVTDQTAEYKLEESSRDCGDSPVLTFMSQFLLSFPFVSSAFRLGGSSTSAVRSLFVPPTR